MYYLGYPPTKGNTLKMPYQSSCATSQFDSFSEKHNHASVNVMRAFFILKHVIGRWNVSFSLHNCTVIKY